MSELIWFDDGDFHTAISDYGLINVSVWSNGDWVVDVPESIHDRDMTPVANGTAASVEEAKAEAQRVADQIDEEALDDYLMQGGSADTWRGMPETGEAVTYEAGYDTGYADAVKDLRKKAQSEWEETTGVWQKEIGDPDGGGYVLTVEMADPTIHQELIEEPYDEDNYAWFVLGGRFADTLVDAGWASSVDQGKQLAEEAASRGPSDEASDVSFTAEEILRLLTEVVEGDLTEVEFQKATDEEAYATVTDNLGKRWVVHVTEEA